MSQRLGDVIRQNGRAMKFRKSISTVLLATLLMWSMSALCAPITLMPAPVKDRLLYRAMVMEHPHTAHPFAPSQKVVVIVCYRMHGDHDNDTFTRGLSLPGDEAISGTAKFHDGKARACAMAHATKLLIATSELSGATWERIGPSRSVFEAKADLRI